MKKMISVQFSLFIVLFLCGSVSAGIEELFTDIESPASKDGLVLEIALPKETYFYFEPVTFYARFRNTTDSTIAVVLEEGGLTGIASRLYWESSPLDGMEHRPDPYSTTIPNMFLIPGHGTVNFALPDKLFSVGRTRIAAQYSYTNLYPPSPLEGISVWEGKIKSNELVVVVQDKETLTSEELRLVNEKIWRHIGLFSTSDRFTGYRAEGHLIRMSKYSVPILKECLRHKDSFIRLHAISALGRIADKGLAKEIGFRRDVSSLDDLISSYDREIDPSIKQEVVSALMYFKDVEPEKHDLVIHTIRRAINHTDKSLRRTAAVVLLRFSKEDGIPVVIDKIGDKTYFGEVGQKIVLGVLQEETGQNFGPSSRKWKEWWVCCWHYLDKISPLLVLAVAILALYVAIQSRRVSRGATQGSLKDYRDK